MPFSSMNPTGREAGRLPGLNHVIKMGVAMNDALLLYIFLALMVFNLLASVVYALGLNQMRVRVQRHLKQQLQNPNTDVTRAV